MNSWIVNEGLLCRHIFIDQEACDSDQYRVTLYLFRQDYGDDILQWLKSIRHERLYKTKQIIEFFVYSTEAVLFKMIFQPG